MSSTSRETKYCNAIREYLLTVGHATNASILLELQKTYPRLSATTVHRATARLLERGELSLAPADAHGSMRYDTTTTPHDHFMCSQCERLRDVDIAQELIDLVESKLDGCKISGRVTVTGVCRACAEEENK